MTNMFGDSVKACSTLAWLVLLGCFCVSSSTVYAQCSSPTAGEGEQEWSDTSSIYAVCAGTEWLDLTCKDVPGCTPTSVAYENRLTDATNLVTIADSAFNDDQSNLVVLDQWAGVVVLTVGSPPSAPTYAGKVTGAAYSDGNNIEVYGNYAFSTARGGPHLVSTDISTPS